MTNPKSYIFPLVIVAFIFFVFGFIIWLNGILIPYFQICLELNNFQASLVVFAAYIAYFLMSLPSARILRATGYKKGMALGLSVMAFGTLLFIPAAYTRIYSIFLTGLFITGSGLTLLQTAANPYVAIIGPTESTAQRVGFLGLANKIAGIFSITLLGSIFLFKADNLIAILSKAGLAEKARLLDIYALKIVVPYIIITAVLLLLAGLIYFSNMPEINESEIQSDSSKNEIKSRSSIFQYPYLILGVISMFFAISCEIIPIDSIIIYSRSLGLPIEEARHFPTYTLYAMLLGYLATTIFIPKFVSQARAMQFSAVWGILLLCLSFFTKGRLSIVFLVLTGFGTAILWGTIWGLSIRQLGKYTKTGSAMLLMGVIGGAITPVIFGRLIDANQLHPQFALLIVIPFYLVLLVFSSWGCRLESWKIIPYSKRKN